MSARETIVNRARRSGVQSLVRDSRKKQRLDRVDGRPNEFGESVGRVSPEDSGGVLDRWLTAERVEIGRHILWVLAETEGARDAVIAELCDVVRSHYVSPETMARRLEELGASQTASVMREHLPESKTARSADMGEILATECAEWRLGYEVPIRRLRWKDGREVPLRGDDLVGLSRDEKQRLQFLKGEAKSRAALTTAVIQEATEALGDNEGRPTRHSVLFVAERLRDNGSHDLAAELEEAVLRSFRGLTVEHFVFALAGNDPEKFLSDHLHACAETKQLQHAMGVRVEDHGRFIALVYERL